MLRTRVLNSRSAVDLVKIRLMDSTLDTGSPLALRSSFWIAGLSECSLPGVRTTQTVGENLCNLHEIPAPFHSFTASVPPIKWRGASAAPARAVAILSN